MIIDYIKKINHFLNIIFCDGVTLKFAADSTYQPSQSTSKIPATPSTCGDPGPPYTEGSAVIFRCRKIA